MNTHVNDIKWPNCDLIVYKEHEGLSTYYAKHKRDLPKPNYPMPVTMYDADISIMHLSLSACRYSNDGPCCICIDKWLEELGYNFGYED